MKGSLFTPFILFVPLLYTSHKVYQRHQKDQNLVQKKKAIEKKILFKRIYKPLSKVMEQLQGTIILGPTNTRNNPKHAIAIDNQHRFFSHDFRDGNRYCYTHVRNNEEKYVSKSVITKGNDLFSLSIFRNTIRSQGLDLLKLPPDYKAFEGIYKMAQYTHQMRTANCEFGAAYYFRELWAEVSALNKKGENPGIWRIELVKVEDMDHYLILINRQEKSDPSLPKTWGDCYIVDWWGRETASHIPRIFPALEFHKQMVKLDNIYPNLLEGQHLPKTFGINVQFEVKPEKLPYKEVGYHFTLPLDEYDVKSGDQYKDTDNEYKKAQENHLKRLRGVHDQMMATHGGIQDKQKEMEVPTTIPISGHSCY